MPRSFPSPGYRAPTLLLVLLATAPLPATTPLHQRIDQAVAAGKPDFDAHASPLASDAEFLRRIYLDLTGSIPSAAVARAFLDEASPAKRGQLIDRLLASPEHA